MTKFLVHTVRQQLNTLIDQVYSICFEYWDIGLSYDVNLGFDLVLNLCLKVFSAGLLPNWKVVYYLGAKSHLSKLLWSENKVAIPHNGVSSTTSQLTTELNIFRQHINTTERRSIPHNGLSSTTSQPTTQLTQHRHRNR